MKKLKFLLVACDKVFWEGLIRIIEKRLDTEIVGVCVTGDEAIRKAAERKPDVILIDEGVKDCGVLEVSHSVKRSLPLSLIGIVTTVYPCSDTMSILKAEADIYIDKDITTLNMNLTIDRWHENVDFHKVGMLISPLVAEMLVKRADVSKQHELSDLKESTFGLTKREAEILNLVAQGKVNKEIASILFITENTVKAHLGSIYDKLHVQNRHQITSMLREKSIPGIGK